LLAEEKLLRLLEKALKKQKKRKPTRIPKVAKEARVQAKKRLSEKKAIRRGEIKRDERGW